MTPVNVHGESAQETVASVEEFASIMDSTFKNLKSRFDKSSGDILSKSEFCVLVSNSGLTMDSGGACFPNG